MTAAEVRDAIREYCVNTTGLIDAKMMLVDVRVDDDGIKAEFMDHVSANQLPPEHPFNKT